MKLVNKKTRKAIRKSVKKLIKKHGPELAADAGGWRFVPEALWRLDGWRSRERSEEGDQRQVVQKKEDRPQKASASGTLAVSDVAAVASTVTGTVRTLLRGSKDTALGVAARSFVNTRLRGIGEVTDLAIDTEQRLVQCRLHLAGEAKPISVEIGKYSLKASGDRVTMKIVEASTSREWLTAALQTFVVARIFRIPHAAAAALKLLNVTLALTRKPCVSEVPLLSCRRS
jgi:hypothetical protein